MVKSMSISFKLDKINIKIETSVIDLINSFRQFKLTDCEAGGILIGRENKETGNIIIEYATEPYDKDRMTRTSFHRKDKKHINMYNQLYKENNGIYAYIGEWHTHPEDFPNYSYTDIKNWTKISNINKDKNKVYYHIIVGRKEIRIWEYRFDSKEAKRVY